MEAHLRHQQKLESIGGSPAGWRMKSTTPSPESWLRAVDCGQDRQDQPIGRIRFGDHLPNRTRSNHRGQPAYLRPARDGVS